MVKSERGSCACAGRHGQPARARDNRLAGVWRILGLECHRSRRQPDEFATGTRLPTSNVLETRRDVVPEPRRVTFPDGSKFRDDRVCFPLRHPRAPPRLGQRDRSHER